MSKSAAGARPKRKRSAQSPTKPPGGASAWAALFDLDQVDRLCEAVRVSVSNGVLGYPSDLWMDLRTEVGAPLGAYILNQLGGVEGKAVREMRQIAPALMLADAVERLACLFEARYAFVMGDADREAAELRSLWLQVITAEAVPYLRASKVRLQKQAREAAAQSRAAGRELSEDAVVRAIVEQPGRQRKALILELTERFNVSERTVQRRISAAKKKNLVP